LTIRPAGANFSVRDGAAEREAEMAGRYNPFRPGKIVTPGMFSGRYDELAALEHALNQTKHNNAHHFLIHGERGIGKSSLLLYLQYVATGDIPAMDNTRCSFLVVNLDLEPAITYADLIQRIGAGFQRVIASRERLKELAKSAWDFIKRWEVMGVKYSNHRNGSVEPHQLLDDLVHTIAATLESLGSEVDGLLIMIDEADKPPIEANLGEFCKLFTERLSKRGCNRVVLGLAGLTEVIAKLRASHESSPRIFEMLTLHPLNEDDTVNVIRKGLAELKREAGIEVAVTPDAEALIAKLSEGYPHFIQQFAYSACEQDTDSNIAVEDVQAGATGKNGALQQLGLKYFHELYFDQIGSDEYRGVLKVMSQHGTEWVSKEDIRKALKLKETTLGNAISALKNRHIILAKDGQKGTYRLPTESFAAWIRAFTEETAPLFANDKHRG
jgi:DNA polymerase III delta prime subunit